MGQPPAVELAWGWGPLEGRAERCVLALASIGSQLPTGISCRKRGGGVGGRLACDLSKHVDISSNFHAHAHLLGCHMLQGQRDVETLKKRSACGLT